MTFPSRPSIADIARVAGVSPMLVSSVVSGSAEPTATVSPAVTQRVRAAMRSLGYPEHGRPERVGSRPQRVLLLVCHVSSGYSRMLIDHTRRALAEHGLAAVVQEGEGAEPILRAARMLADGLVDGLILETDDETAATLDDIAASGHPVVAIGPKFAGAAHDVLTADDTTAIRDVMLHLVDHQFERFVLISPRSDSNRDHRTTIARDQLRALGVPTDRIATMYSIRDAVAAFDTISPALDSLQTPVAIVAGSDSSAIGALWACLRAGRAVPNDIAILGHGNTPEAAITCPPISTIGPEPPDLRRAADLIAARIAQPSLPGRHIVEPWRFLPRQTT